MKISVILFSFFISGCAYFEEQTSVERAPSDREEMFMKAEDFFNGNDFESAKNLYFRLSRNVEGNFDPIYDQSLWRLVKIYEKNDESEKALLTLDELILRKTNTISKNKIKFSQLKNNFRATNYYQAKEIKKDLDEAYKNRSLSLEELYQNLIETTDLSYDHHILEELLYLGEVQKYFVFVMESSMNPENEKLTDRLIENYEHFFSVLKRSTLSAQLQKKLAVSLLDQLQKFNQYKIDSANTNEKTILKFIQYSEKQQKLLIESLRQ